MVMLDCLLKTGEKWLLVILCLFLALFMGMTSITATKSNPSYHNFEVDAQLKLLNKPAVKSIKSLDGDVIDCIKITDQPAFDHPLLKNHTIQMAPKFYPKALFGHKNVSSKMKITKTQLWQLNGSCPKGTIPVRRTKQEDLLRAGSIKGFGKKKHSSIPQPRSENTSLITRSVHQYAVAYVSGDKYYGTEATINIWKPNVQQPDEFSLSQLWIVAGTSGIDVNTIEAGWQIYPNLYGDYNTRLFIYWTRDAYQHTGCYNLLCSGFVQTNNNLAMGGTLDPTSTYQGAQYVINLLVWKDPDTGNWWMRLNDESVGYWPGSLFTHLAHSASSIEWGGEIIDLESNGEHTSTHMGSGHWPGEGYGKASFFKSLQIVDGSNTLRSLNRIATITGNADCYDINIRQGGNWGKYFYYGGPGRSQSCQ